MHQRAAAIVPGAPEWLAHLEALATDYLRQDARPVVRSRTLSVLGGVYASARFVYRHALVTRILVPFLATDTPKAPPPLLDADDAVATVALGLAIEAAVDCAGAHTGPAAVAPLVAVLERIAHGDDIVRAVVATRGLLDLWQTLLYVGPAEACIAQFGRLLALAAPEPAQLDAEAADEGARARAERSRRARSAARLEVLRVLLRLRAQPSGRLFLLPADHGHPHAHPHGTATPGAGAGEPGGLRSVATSAISQRIASTIVRVAPAATEGAPGLLPIGDYAQYDPRRAYGACAAPAHSVTHRWPCLSTSAGCYRSSCSRPSWTTRSA